MRLAAFKSEVADKIGGRFSLCIMKCIDESIVKRIKEIRIRAEKPVIVLTDRESFFVTNNGFAEIAENMIGFDI